MFDFLKKHKTHDISEIPYLKQELKLSVRERALNIFSNIEGLDDIKEMMLRALESRESSYIADRTPCLCKIIVYVRDRERHAVRGIFYRRS